MPVDLCASIYAQYKRARKRAEEAERRGALPEAAAAYRQAATWMKQYAQECSADAGIRQQRQRRVAALENAAQHLDDLSQGRSRPGERRAPEPDVPTGEDDYEAEALALIQQTHVRWEDIGGLEETKAAIKSAYGLALARKPQGVQIDSWRNVLLYGPPGTGKTILAAATAGSLDATFFNVKVSNLLSKYFGESTKLISALYTVARRLAPAVVFLDEFESLTPPRGSGESGAERRIVSTFLAELDGLESRADPAFVLTIGATNTPWLIDTAVLSRFQRRIHVPLPDEAARLAIFEIHLTRRGHQSQIPLETLALRSEGYSGREIEQLCQTAIARMTQRANPGLLAVVDRGQEAVQAYEIRVESLSVQDFEAAFEQIRPVTNRALLQRYTDWQRTQTA